MIALLIIATGERYRKFAKNLIISAKQFLTAHDVILFTDEAGGFIGDDFNHVKLIIQEDLGFPGSSLMRYHAFTNARKVLQNYQHVYYIDADMQFVAPVTEEEINSDGITATQHPGYISTKGTPELRPESTAYCPEPRMYFCGGFNGGATSAFLKMAETIKNNIDQDTTNGIMAVWFDESHLNRYLYDNPPAKILDPSFCYPETKNEYYRNLWAHCQLDIIPKILALYKGDS